MKPDDFAQYITVDQYMRERLQPLRDDRLYLHLQDLRSSLDSIRSDVRLKVLDYGCGSSPYRGLFPKSEYKRADFLDTGSLDYKLSADSRVPEINAQFDLVLSTQVIEHVPEPQIYLSECFRLLRPGGKLFVSTHGLYEDHGCPYDYFRWTADGLNLNLTKAGFQNIQIQKLTTGPRAILFLMGTSLGYFYGKNGTTVGLFLGWYRQLFERFRHRIHAMSDTQFSHCCIVPATEPGHSLYICLAAQAERPS